MKKLLAILLFIVIIPVYGITVSAEEGEQVVFEETLEEIVNPDCGFYKAFSGYLMRNSDQSPISESKISSERLNYGLYHLRIGLEDFSSNAGGVDSEIDATAKLGLEQMLSYLRDYKISAIIRFSYNVTGACDSSDNYLENEPSIDLIVKHIKALGEVISKYSDVIIGVDSGMVGPWGEQHSTALGSASKSNAKTYYKIVEAWLNSLPQNIAVGVRRPKYFVYWANEKYGLSLTESSLANFSAEDYPEAKRVAVYNDGYLGSSSDLGTFVDRNAEIIFIGKQAENTLYGGEVVADRDTDAIGEYNDVDYLEVEGFITHTSYLNIDWNYDAVISNWQTSTYNGQDKLYKNKVTDFTFVKNRLGYRLVLQGVSAPTIIKAGDTLSLGIDMQNKGFASLMRNPVCTVIFESENVTESVNCELDLLSLKSRQSKSYTLEVTVPSNLKTQNYNLYLKCETAYGRAIRFANDSQRYSESLQANLLTNIAVQANAQNREKFLVTFDGNYGELVSGESSQIVKRGESAIAPVFERAGYIFVGWDKDFSCITQDTAVTAIWQKSEIVNPSESSSEEEQNSETDEVTSKSCNMSLSVGSPAIFALAIFVILKKIFSK